MSDKLSIAQYIPNSISNGPGHRAVIGFMVVIKIALIAVIPNSKNLKIQIQMLKLFYISLLVIL